MTDPIADMLTRIRNAILAKHEEVNIPASRMKREILTILKEEGFIEDFRFVQDEEFRYGILKVFLRYDKKGKSGILGLKRVSKPGLRAYTKHEAIPRVLNGLGLAIISTSKGVLSDYACRSAGIGGEILCYVW